MNTKHCTPTLIFNRIAEQARIDYNIPAARARKLVKQALGLDGVRAMILEAVGDTLIDEATAMITDTRSPGIIHKGNGIRTALCGHTSRLYGQDLTVFDSLVTCPAKLKKTKGRTK